MFGWGGGWRSRELIKRDEESGFNHGWSLEGGEVGRKKMVAYEIKILSAAAEEKGVRRRH